MPDPRKVLVIRPRFFGDLILATGLAEIFHREWPGVEVRYLTESRYSEILRDHSFIQGVLDFNSGMKNNLFYLAGFYRRLREYKPDLVLDLFGNPRTAQMSFFSGAKTRIGFDLRGRTWAYSRLAPPSSPILPSGRRSAIEAYLDQARAAGLKAEEPYQTLLAVTEAEREYVGKLFERAGIAPGTPVAFLNPGASWPAKHWPLERFIELGFRLKSKGFRLIYHFGPGDQKLLESFQDRMDKDWILLNQPSLRGLMAFIESSDVLVSNDTGTMHIGPAVGTPTVGLFGPQDPEIWFNYPKPHVAAYAEIACSHCGLDVCPLMACLDHLTSLDVARSAISAAAQKTSKNR